MKKLAILFMGLLILSGILFPSSGFKMVKEQTVKSGQRYDKSMMSFRGAITVETGGYVDGSIIMLGGTLKLDGEVNEDVICVSSTIQLGPKAHINGDFFVISGTLTPTDKIEIEAKVKGEYLNFKFNLKKIESTLLPLFSDSQSLAIFKAVKIVFWLIITLIVFAVVPRKINLAEDIFRTHLLKIGSIGIISLFTFICLMFLFLVLSLIIIGIPLLFVLVLAYFWAYIFGRTVMFYFIGITLAKQFKLKKITPALFILIGVLVYAILKFVPFVGPIVLILMNICEVGIGVGFFFRKKLKLER